MNLIRGLQRNGYEIHFFYLWVPSVELALARVRGRVSSGGHNVPEALVRRRFDRSITNFLVHYRPLADSWNLYDNTAMTPKIIVFEEEGQLRILETKQYNDLIESYGRV